MSINENKKKDRFELFSKLITHMPMVFYVLDKDGVFILSDGQGLQKLGLKPGEVVGLSAMDVYKDFPDIIEALENAYAGKNIKYEHRIGNLFLENYVAPYYDADGHIDGVIGATIDISERKTNELELKKSRALQEALMESIPGMIYIYNEAGELVFWNKWHETMTGYSGEELFHKSLMDWYANDKESQKAILKGLENTAVHGFGEAEADLQRKDGSKIQLYLTACPLKVDEKNCFVGIGVDISSRKEAEHKLMELNRTLEEKVKERTIELNDVNEDLTAANEELRAMNEEMLSINSELATSNEQLHKMKDFLVETEKMAALGGLVAGVAHEVNTPIGVGITAVSHLMDISNELLNLHKSRPLSEEDLIPYLEDLEKASHIIFNNLNRAAHLIQSFKKLSVDQSTEPKRQFDIGTYIDEIILSLSPSLKKTHIKITMNCPETIIVDGYPGSIAQIITNLVMNSIKHAYQPNDIGNIKIDVSRKHSMIQIIYSDDGCGMDEYTLSKIYEPFFTTDRSTGGTGLGLAIVYTIVTQQYEGSIKCNSQLGQGTTFRITIKEKPV